MRIPLLLTLLPLLLAVAAPVRAAGLTPEEVRALVAELDERQRNSGDYKALAYLERKEKDKDDLVYQLVVYRRDADDKLMMLFTVHHLELKAKEDADVAYPVLHIWVDAATKNLLKQQERALSGKLMRTAYYPKWEKMFSPSKGAEIYFPREIRIFDEIEKGNRSTIVIQKLDLGTLPPNIFTKAWLESRSR